MTEQANETEFCAKISLLWDEAHASCHFFALNFLALEHICFKRVISTKRPGRRVSSEEAVFLPVNPLGEFWYNGALCGPGCTSFLPVPGFQRS
jgi:hypothetical protein